MNSSRARKTLKVSKVSTRAMTRLRLSLLTVLTARTITGSVETERIRTRRWTAGKRAFSDLPPLRTENHQIETNIKGKKTSSSKRKTLARVASFLNNEIEYTTTKGKGWCF